MNKLALIAAFAFFALPVSAQASEHAAPAAEHAAPAAEAKEVTLKDGTKVSIHGDMVSVVAADGKKEPAKDGEHELADGTKVVTKDGKLVHPAGHEAPAKH
jgi:hypothetical protein